MGEVNGGKGNGKDKKSVRREGRVLQRKEAVNQIAPPENESMDLPASCDGLI